LALRVAELLAVPLDRGRPLWELHVLSGMADGSVAVLAKMHHALADGLRAVVIGMALFDQPDTTARHPSVPAASAADTSAAEPSNAERPNAGLAARLAGVTAGLSRPARAMLNTRLVSGELARYAGQARDVAAIGTSIVGAVARPAPACLTLNPAAARRYAALTSATDGPVRRFAMLSMDLDAVRTVGKTHGGTVNDVLLTVLAGGLRSWLAERGHPQPRPLRALVPVSSPHPDPGGNRLSGYLVELPVDDPDPLRRLSRVRAAMRANKTAGPSRGAGAFPLLAERTPQLVHRLAAPIVAPLTAPLAGRLFNTVITHVPLPRVQLAVAGVPLTEIYPAVPLAAGQALGIAISTYQSVAHLGLRADHATIPDLDRLTKHISTALDELGAQPVPTHHD
jgi:WS/DGAT/MGAT family acyltransferase